MQTAWQADDETERSDELEDERELDRVRDMDQRELEAERLAENF